MGATRQTGPESDWHVQLFRRNALVDESGRNLVAELKGIGPGAVPGDENTRGFAVDSLGTQPGDGPCQVIIIMNPFPMMYEVRRTGLPAPHCAAAGRKSGQRLDLSVSHL